MNSDKKFFKTVCQLAIPVTLQSMLQSSFSIVDQIMIGQLGTIPVAGVGFAGKFSSIFTVVVSAVGAVAGIMISQYVGQKNGREVRRSFLVNLWLALAVAGIFTALCLCFPQWLMGLYTGEVATREAAVDYLQIIAGTFLPLAGATLLSTLYRCTDRPQIPLYASLASALLNTGLNYVLIFGKLGFAPMGARGAALATVASQCANLVLMLLLMPRHKTILPGRSCAGKLRERMNWRQYLAILLPILACEMLWSLGENVYAGIYGHIGTEASAAMVLTNPIQGLMIGALCGLSQAAGVIVGKSLGNAEYDEAYMASKKMLRYGFVGACLLSVIMLLFRGLYVQIYRVEPTVRALTMQILLAYSIILPFKILNMVLGSGILRSGGRTKYVMLINLIGTWCFGVPLGLLSAFVLQWSIPYVYFMLSLEECVRFAISLVVFRKRKWMHRLRAEESPA